MKVLLAAVNAKYIHSNLAVYSLRAYALQRCDGICPREIEIAEYTINQPPDEILMDIYGHQPDILCLSCYLWNIISVENLVREIPKILPGIQIWLGGPEVSYNAREMLDKYPEITGIIRGEGEETFADLMDIYHRQPDKKENFSAVKGITYWDEEGKVVETPPQDVMDLSRIPFVYEHIEDFRNRIIYYESSRGCPFSCSYCLSSIDKCLRFRDLRLVEKEVKFFIDHGVPQVKFVDRTFNCRHDHAMAVWSYIKKYDRGITNFHFEVAADLLNDEEIELIRSMRPGLIQLEIGVQSANERTIREIQRTMKLDQVRDRVARIKEMKNVHQHLDLIAGLPYEGYDSFARSFDIVYDMEPEQLQLGLLKVLKGALMHDKAEEYQLLYQDRPPYEVLSTKWLSYGELIRLKQIEEMVEVYYNSGQFRNTIKHLRKEFSSPFAMYEALAAYYRENGLFGRQYSRIARYEILHHFIEVGKQQEYLEWLTLDLYLRDNVKNRPPFLGENKVTKEEASAFYRAEASERRYLKGYEGYDSRQMRKMTHLERIGGKLILFDYQRRDALIGDARICVIENF